MLELRQAEGCGYSATVREALADLGVPYVVHNPSTAGGEVRNEQAHDPRLELGGRDQIPFPVDRRHEVAMYESDDVGAYRDERYR